MTVARRGLHPAGRTDDDDRPAVAGVDHRRDDRPQGAPGAGEVDVDDGVPLLVGQLPEPAPAQHPGVGHHDVQPAEALQSVGDQPAQCGVVADVDGGGVHRDTLGPDQPDRLGQIIGGGRLVGDARRHRPADIAEDQVGSVAGQPHRIGAALPAGRPGHQRHAPSQRTCGHLRSFRQPRARLTSQRRSGSVGRGSSGSRVPSANASAASTSIAVIGRPNQYIQFSSGLAIGPRAK